ncbi:LysR substrate-binding domain-containing protein [Leucobacter allii]|uniref:LysR substrate-binding domain-containing protein n=1 Tax=Leucobacter allii TaxID=2932247 RepID=A0ABY4FNR4_9MICO|nr:LysR substrate-binding domain-containing protein [Leucobacter allii]UOQ57891.1 LysR substrate-binding domain-containing protein [Leucobacter allii]
MEIAQLEIFAAVAEHGGVIKASEALLRAPSNVSTRIKQLERELGVQLLVRDKRQSSISSDGMAFLEYARRILELVEESRTIGGGGAPRGRFRVGALESAAAVRIPSILAGFHLAYPDVEVELEAGASGSMFDRVMSGSLSAVFTDGPPASPVLAGLRAFEEQLVVISPPSTAGLDDPYWSNNPTAFVFGFQCSYRQRFDDWMAATGVVPARSVEISSYYSMVACVASGAGIAMIPSSLLASLPGASGVRRHEIGALGRAETWLTWRRDAGSVNLRAFVAHVRSAVGAEESEPETPSAATPA